MHDLSRLPAGFTKRHAAKADKRKPKPAKPERLTAEEHPAQAIAAGICTLLAIALLFALASLAQH